MPTLDRRSLLDTPLSEILEKNQKLARMTPREIVERLRFLKCRLSISPGHPCKQQLPFVTFKSVRFEMDSIFVLDSCVWYGEHWVIRMGIGCALLLCTSPVRTVQKASDFGEEPVLATVPPPELCQCMEIMPAARYLELLHKATIAEQRRKT